VDNNRATTNALLTPCYLAVAELLVRLCAVLLDACPSLNFKTCKPRQLRSYSFILMRSRHARLLQCRLMEVIVTWGIFIALAVSTAFIIITTTDRSLSQPIPHIRVESPCRLGEITGRLRGCSFSLSPSPKTICMRAVKFYTSRCSVRNNPVKGRAAALSAAEACTACKWPQINERKIIVSTQDRKQKQRMKG